MRLLLVCFITFIYLSHSNLVFAHAEEGKALFVANSGEDKGNCANRFRPCQTIAYAATQAAKGDRILIAKGRYSTGLAYLISELVPVFGGYDPMDNFQQQSPQQHPTYLTGVPSEYADQLSKKGFVVIADSKTSADSNLAKNIAGLAHLSQKQNRQDCVDGQAGQFECQNIALIGHVPLSEFEGNNNAANDIWGHVDLNTGKEYAIIGLRNGTSVVDVSEPTNPNIIGYIPGRASTWRDIKVFQFYQDNNKTWRAYAYVTTDSVVDEGVAIIDLNQLAQNQISLVTKQLIHNSAHNVYISGVDYGLNIAAPNNTPVLHITGADRNGGAIQSYSLDNPEQLTTLFDATGSPRSDYSHDATSLMIADERASQCPNATEQGCLVMVDYNEQEVVFWDQSSLNQRSRLSNATYSNIDYVHSGWWSEDKRYVFVHDEGDEQTFGVNTTVQIFEISDLTAPRYVGLWRGTTPAIDHNGFVRGSRYYMANYTRGLTILDISDPEQPTEAGFFDTFPTSDVASFNGVWGTYPYLPSGNILVSDINSGLYILDDLTSEGDVSRVAFTAEAFQGEEGQQVTVSVERLGDASEATQVSFQTLPGSASSDDFTAVSGVLEWSAGDDSAKTFTVDIANDQVDDEFEEQLFVRLFNPRDGLSLAKNNLANVTITGQQNNGVAAFNETAVSLLENGAASTVTVNRNGGNTGALVVNYELLSGSGTVAEDIEEATGELRWEDQQQTSLSIALTPIDDQLNESDETFTLRLFSANENQPIGSPNKITVTLRDDESNEPPSVSAGNNSQANVRQTVQLNGSAQDSQGSQLQFQWSQESGTSVTLNNPDTLTPTFVAPSQAGELSFLLTVTDEFGASGTDSVNITVVAAPVQPPASSNGGGGSIGWLSLIALCIGFKLVKKPV